MTQSLKWIAILVLGSCMAAPVLAEVRSTPAAAVTGWRAKTTDNICGLSDTRMLSNPAKVRFDSLLEATSEMKKMQREGIDPNSPTGIRLRQSALKAVTRACEAVRTAGGHCSVWRDIRHSGGQVATDITALVEAQL